MRAKECCYIMYSEVVVIGKCLLKVTEKYFKIILTFNQVSNNKLRRPVPSTDLTLFVRSVPFEPDTLG